MSNSNGETKLVETMTVDEKLDLIIEALTDLSNKLDLMDEELTERIANLSVEGSAYGIELLEES